MEVKAIDDKTGKAEWYSATPIKFTTKMYDGMRKFRYTYKDGQDWEQWFAPYDIRVKKRILEIKTENQWVPATPDETQQNAYVYVWPDNGRRYVETHIFKSRVRHRDIYIPMLDNDKNVFVSKDLGLQVLRQIQHMPYDRVRCEMSDAKINPYIDAIIKDEELNVIVTDHVAIEFASGNAKFEDFDLGYIRGLMDGSRHDICVIPLGIEYPGESHANMLIIIRKNESEFLIEHFEPHGKLPVKHQSKQWIQVQEVLRKMIKSIYPPGTEFSSSVDVCPGLGPQFKEKPHTKGCTEAGLCVAWATMYAELRIRNPKATHDAIVTEMFDLLKLDMFMQRYIAHITEIVNMSTKQQVIEEEFVAHPKRIKK
jgi:hypothetical protein